MKYNYVNMAPILLSATVVALYFGAGPLKRYVRKRAYRRGRRIKNNAPRKLRDGLQFGMSTLPESAATGHFLIVGTTGSGKSHVQRRLMAPELRNIKPGTDRRSLIFDAKNDAVPLLKKLGVTVPVYSLNPFEKRTDFPIAAAWDIAADITSSARAMNLAASFFPSEKGGNNQYFSDAAKQVVTALVESFIRHSPSDWSFSDLVYACLSLKRMEAILERDDQGVEIMGAFYSEERLRYQVFTTIVSRMAYFRPVAALWAKRQAKLSIRDWLKGESVLLLGANATAKAALNAINEQLFRVLVEEIDMQVNSNTRRTWIWIDEARLSGPLLRGEMVPFLAVKGRSKGAALVLSFQDIEGFREAATPRIANEIVAQCSHKALLRMESEESATWASKILGQFEAIEYFRTESNKRGSGSLSEQRVTKDAVLPSEFYSIPVTSKENGLTGYFVSPEIHAYQAVIPASEISPLIVSQKDEEEYGFQPRDEEDQWLTGWKRSDEKRLGLAQDLEPRKQLRFKEVSKVNDVNFDDV